MKRREFIRLIGSAALTLPETLAAQPAKVPKVGYLWHAGSAREEDPYYSAVITGFRKLGYINKTTITLEHRFPDEKPERFASMAAELVSMNPDVLMGGSIGSLYLQAATKTIPIVFMFVPDPVGMRLVESLSHPGGDALLHSIARLVTLWQLMSAFRGRADILAR